MKKTLVLLSALALVALGAAPAMALAVLSVSYDYFFDGTVDDGSAEADLSDASLLRAKVGLVGFVAGVDYFTGSDDGRLRLEALGVPPGKVAATGIPIDPVFGAMQDQAEARRELGLDPDRTTILVASGGWGMGPIEKVVRSLQGMHSQAQVVVVCALNNRLKTAMDRVACAGGPVKVVPIGWTTRMHTYMSAADLVIGKTGGLTISETLAKGLPFLIVQPIKGQEERNADYLLEEGAALRCNNLLTVAHKVDMLLNNPEYLTRLRANARRLARPHAACDIVRMLQRLETGVQAATPVGAVEERRIPDLVPT